MELKIAALSDIEDVLALHYTYQVDSIAPEDKADGFVTTPFTAAQLSALIEQERPHLVVPEIEAIATDMLVDITSSPGFQRAGLRRQGQRRRTQPDQKSC